MRVGLNLIYLVPGETGGTETYARELIPALAAAAPDLDLVAFVNREAARERFDGARTVVLPIRARRRAEWVAGEQVLLPRAATREGVDLLHSLASTAPAAGRFRRVVTIHDLLHRTAPDAHFGVRGMALRVLVPLAARRAHRVIADSSAAREDIVRLLHVPPEHLEVVPLGVRTPPSPPDPAAVAAACARYGAGERPLVLTLSALRPHKNLPRLLEALAALEPRPVLVAPGYRTPHQDELRARASALGVDAHFPGWLPAAEVEALYAAATAFVFPSLAEGFGLPVLEALARGVPVACSGTGAVAEVAGDAARTFDPRSVPAMAEAITAVLTDQALRARLREAGPRRAAAYTWERTARLTLGAYRRASA